MPSATCKGVPKTDSLSGAGVCPVHGLELTRYDGSCSACCRDWARRKSEALLAQLACSKQGLRKPEK